MLPSPMNDPLTYSYGNLSIAYQKTGSGKPLIVLHGWGTGGRVMMPLVKQLSHLRTCYVIDLPGFGESSVPESPWYIDDYADMIESFIRSLDESPVDMLVHSFGGRITLKICARPFGSEYISKVLITGGAGMKPRRSFTYYLKKYTVKLLKAPFQLLPVKQRHKAMDWLRSTTLWKALGSSDYSRLSGVMRETFVRSVTEFLEPTLPKIQHEVLLLWGENDEATPLYQARRMEEGIEHAALVTLEHAGHYAFLDRPKYFASIAEAFFTEDARRQTGGRGRPV